MVVGPELSLVCAGGFVAVSELLRKHKFQCRCGLLSGCWQFGVFEWPLWLCPGVYWCQRRGDFGG